MPGLDRKPAVGELDKRVRIERMLSPDEDATLRSAATGGEKARWTPLAEVPTVWAKVEQVPGGDEFDEHGRWQPKSLWKVTIRRRPDVTALMRFMYGSRALYIRGTGDDSLRSEFVEYTCSEYSA